MKNKTFSSKSFYFVHLEAFLTRAQPWMRVSFFFIKSSDVWEQLWILSWLLRTFGNLRYLYPPIRSLFITRCNRIKNRKLVIALPEGLRAVEIFGLLPTLLFLVNTPAALLFFFLQMHRFIRGSRLVTLSKFHWAFLVLGFCLRLVILFENEASCKIADTFKLGFCVRLV